MHEVLITSGAATAAALLLLWLLSLRLRDASIVDIYWGLGFAQIAIVACGLGGGHPWRKLLVTGLTRHPNYFGDACVWWGLFLIAAATGAWWTVISPALMTFFLMRVSGVALLERKLVKTRPEYAEYVRRTSAFVPWPPR